MAAGNKTSAAKARTLDLKNRALEMRRQGRGYVEIGRALGIGKSTAHRYVAEGLKDAADKVAASADELRAEELSRLDALLQSVWTTARSGHLGAVDRVIKIIERRAKLLGLDAPVKLAHGGDPDAPPIHSEQTVYTMTDAELERIARGSRP